MTPTPHPSALRTLIKATLVGAVASVPVVGYAAGFSLTEQSVVGLGRSFAGGAAVAEDASTLYYNPAGITRLTQAEVVQGFSLISLTADFDKTSATDAIGQPLSGGEGGPVGKLGGPVTLYYVSPLGDDMAWGVGINAPFGLATDYERDWVGRYQGVYSRVGIINIQPTIAKKWDKVSFGIGFDVQYMEVKLQQEIDMGAACFGVGPGPVTCSALGLTPQNADGAVTLEGDGIAYGWNWGVLFEDGGTRIGIAYRSQVAHELDGTADFNRAPAAFTGLGLFVDTGIKADFTTPELLSMGFAQDIGEDWMLTLDLTRTGWDTFQELRVRYDNPLQPDTVEEERWKDVYKTSIGVDWRYSDKWTFRAGYGFDNSPMEDQYRTVRLPDGDRTWMSFGATYKWNDHLEINAGYAYLQLGGGDNLPFDHTGSTNDRLIGTYAGDANIVGIEARMKF
jgi:long-chain fatty acid transport protein